MDQLQAMRCFVRVVEAGSFTRAANHSGLTKGHVTKQIQQLESFLSVKLLNRTTRALTVTSDGAAYYDRAVRLLCDLDELDAGMRQSHSAPKGRLRIDAGASVARLLLIPALPGFFRQHPGIQIDLGVSDRPVDLIADNIDCVIRTGEIAEPSLVARRLGWVSIVTVASPAYLQEFGRPQHPADLERDGHRTVNYFSARTGRSFPHQFVQDGQCLEVPGHYQLAVNDTSSLSASVLAGMGITQLSSFQAAPYLADGSLVRILEDWTHPPFPIHLVYPPNRHLNARVRAFADWAITLLGDMPCLRDRSGRVSAAAARPAAHRAQAETSPALSE